MISRLIDGSVRSIGINLSKRKSMLSISHPSKEKEILLYTQLILILLNHQKLLKLPKTHSLTGKKNKNNLRFFC